MITQKEKPVYMVGNYKYSKPKLVPDTFLTQARELGYIKLAAGKKIDVIDIHETEHGVQIEVDY